MSDQQHNALDTILEQLRMPFHPSHVTWKPGAVKGERALALAYADLRAYMNRLDEVCGTDWAVAYEPWGTDRIICRLTIWGVTRSSTGETSNEAERSEIGGTVAEAQAFKRACAMFGLGRYLYTLPSMWADYDPAKKQFTEKAKAKLMGILMQHYRRATEEARGDSVAALFSETEDVDFSRTSADAVLSPAHDRLQDEGKAVFGAEWEAAQPWLILGWTEMVQHSEPRSSAGQLSDDEADILADYLHRNPKSLRSKWQTQKIISAQPSNGVDKTPGAGAQ